MAKQLFFCLIILLFISACQTPLAQMQRDFSRDSDKIKVPPKPFYSRTEYQRAICYHDCRYPHILTKATVYPWLGYVLYYKDSKLVEALVIEIDADLVVEQWRCETKKGKKN